MVPECIILKEKENILKIYRSILSSFYIRGLRVPGRIQQMPPAKMKTAGKQRDGYNRQHMVYHRNEVVLDQCLIDCCLKI